jgi:acyl carrier protein
LSRAEVEATIRDVFQTVLGRTLSPGENLRRGDDPGWDSLKHVELLFAIEGALGVQFDADELGDLDSFEALVRSAERRLR